MIPTPDISHLTVKDYDLIYEPAEDTFLLLDALEQDSDELKALSPSTCLEIGSGSGCVSSFIGQILGSSSTLYLCTDINPHACKCTRLTGDKNKISLDPVHTSFAHPLRSRLHHSVDIVLFNPPYVPTLTDEAIDAQDATNIVGAWAGGFDGMEITNKFLDMVEVRLLHSPLDVAYSPTSQDLLSPKGRLYLVALKQNNIPEIQNRMLTSYGLHSEIVLSRRTGREHLSIVRFGRVK
ncbi:S-adenosylmethionine-dependent methyltransferase [Marasmius tenuissimus]|uniref:S-adenosylmethionine-dependent methyltransferase n=1 Tax=Marasmius tenuissimus TaxID=585030 RepID=A0ABR3AFD5_9AGAR